MVKAVNILFLGGAKRVSLAEHFIAYGERIGMKVSIFSYELDLKVPISSVGKVIVGLKWNDSNLLKDLRNVILNHQIHIVLPFVDPAIEVASALKNIIPDVFIPCSEVETCQTMLDKKLASEWFAKYGIDQPTLYLPNDTVDFPVIIKPRKGSASKGIEILHSQDEYSKIQNLSDYVIQRYIRNNTEYTVDCYVSSKKQIISIVPRIRLDVAGGEVIKSETIRDESIISLSEKILRTGCFSGPITIQFIKDNVMNRIYVMEINPRLGGGVIASIEAGSGMLSFIIDEFLGKDIEPLTNWKTGTLMTRYFKEVIFYADNN